MVKDGDIWGYIGEGIGEFLLKPLELNRLICYIKNIKEQPPTRWVDFVNEIEIPPRCSAKVLGWFFYVWLLTKGKNKCKQRQKEYAKSQHILKIKMIFHRHHPHSIQNERSAHPATRLLFSQCITNSNILQ